MWIYKEGIVYCEELKKENVYHLTTTRETGNMIIEENLESFLKKQNLKKNMLIRCEQIHSGNVKLVDAKDKGKIIRETDGLITFDNGIILSVFTADCVPVFIFAQDRTQKKKSVGILHAGRRGIREGIIENAMKILISFFTPCDVKVALGPHICKDCYTLDEITGREFKDSFKNGKLDMTNEILKRFIKAGLPVKNIYISKDCTFHNHKRYFSYRKKDIHSRVLSLISLN